MTALTIALMSALIWSRGRVTVESTSYIDRHKMSRAWYVFLNKKLKFWFMTNSTDQLDVHNQDFDSFKDWANDVFEVQALNCILKMSSKVTARRAKSGQINDFNVKYGICSIWCLIHVLESPQNEKLFRFDLYSEVSWKSVDLWSTLEWYLIFSFANGLKDWYETDLSLAGKNFKVSQSALTFQVSFGAEFPVEVQAANNNVGIEYFNGRIYIGFRSVKGFKTPLFYKRAKLG